MQTALLAVIVAQYQITDVQTQQIKLGSGQDQPMVLCAVFVTVTRIHLQSYRCKGAVTVGLPLHVKDKTKQ